LGCSSAGRQGRDTGFLLRLQLNQHTTTLPKEYQDPTLSDFRVPFALCINPGAPGTQAAREREPVGPPPLGGVSWSIWLVIVPQTVSLLALLALQTPQ
jgi:hypothetical protein